MSESELAGGSGGEGAAETLPHYLFAAPESPHHRPPEPAGRTFRVLKGLAGITIRDATVDHTLEVLVYGALSHGKTQFIQSLVRALGGLIYDRISPEENECHANLSAQLDRPWGASTEATSDLSHYVCHWNPWTEARLAYLWARLWQQHALLNLLCGGVVATVSYSLWQNGLAPVLAFVVGCLAFAMREALIAPRTVEVVFWDVPGEYVASTDDKDPNKGGPALANFVRKLVKRRQEVHGERYRVLPVVICNPLCIDRNAEATEAFDKAIRRSLVGRILAGAQSVAREVGGADPLVVVNYRHVVEQLKKTASDKVVQVHLKSKTPDPAGRDTLGKFDVDVKLLKDLQDSLSVSARAVRVVAYDAAELVRDPEIHPAGDDSKKTLYVFLYELPGQEPFDDETRATLHDWLRAGIRLRRPRRIEAPPSPAEGRGKAAAARAEQPSSAEGFGAVEE